MNNNALLANAITARIAPYITTLTGNSSLRNYDENNNSGLHNLNLSLGLMNGNNIDNLNNLNNNGNGINAISKTNNEHLDTCLSKNDLKLNKLAVKKEDEHFSHLNGLKSSNFNLLYSSSNFNLTSLLKN